jgi:hypothetical protein
VEEKVRCNIDQRAADVYRRPPGQGDVLTRRSATSREGADLAAASEDKLD